MSHCSGWDEYIYYTNYWEDGQTRMYCVYTSIIYGTFGQEGRAGKNLQISLFWLNYSLKVQFILAGWCKLSALKLTGIRGF